MYGRHWGGDVNLYRYAGGDAFKSSIKDPWFWAKLGVGTVGFSFGFFNVNLGLNGVGTGIDFLGFGRQSLSFATGGGFNIASPAINISSPLLDYLGSRFDVGAFAASSSGSSSFDVTQASSNETIFRGQGPTEDTSSHWFSWDSAPGTFLSKAGSQLGGAAESFKDSLTNAVAEPIVGAFSSLWNGTAAQDTQQLIDNTGDALWNYDRTASAIGHSVYDTVQGVLAGDPDAGGDALSFVTGGAALKAIRGLRLGGQAAGVIPQGYSRVYRAVSEAEYLDILRTKRFRQGPNSLEGKWFADSIEGARLHGDALQGRGKYRLIEADLPDSAPSLFRQSNLDGYGPARYLHQDDLNNVTPRFLGN